MKIKKIVLIFVLLGVIAVILILHKNCNGDSSAAKVKNETIPSVKSVVNNPPKADIKEKDPVKKAKKETLDELKAAYGRVEILSLYDGRSFMGVTISRGEKIEFKTESGTMFFDAQTVRDTRIIK